MALLSITEGWTGVLGPFTLRVDGEPLALTGFSVAMSLRNPAGAAVAAAGVVTVAPDQGANRGQLSYAPAPTDFLWIEGTYGPVQVYKFHWKVTDGASKVVFFPNGQPDEIEVYPVPEELDLRLEPAVAARALARFLDGRGSGNFGHAGRPGEVGARALGGPGSGYFGHAGRPGLVGGSRPDGEITLLSREDMVKSFREKAAVNELVGGRGQSWNPDDALLDLTGTDAGDRLVALSLVGNPEAKVWAHKDSWKDGTPAARAKEAFKKEAKAAGWSDEKRILAEALARGVLSLEKDETYSSRTSNTTDPFKGSFWGGLDAAGRDRLEDGYIAILKDSKEFSSLSIDKLVAAGWTEPELERFADKLQAAGASYEKFVAGLEIEGRHEEKFLTLDSAAGELAYFSRDHGNFHANMFHEWPISGGDQTIRSVAEKAYPPPPGVDYYRHKPVRYPGDESPERVHRFSDRAVENLKITKAETDAFYAAKKTVRDLDKAVELQRGVAGHVIAYTPGAMESWTSDSRTVDRFGKMMSGQDGAYSALRTTVRYRDLLWTHESHKGSPGLPPDKDLKGKKEFVVLGNAVQNAQVDRRREQGSLKKRGWR